MFCHPKSCTLAPSSIRIGPTVYVRNRDEPALCRALLELLAKHNLGENSGPREVQVRKGCGVCR